MKWNDLWQQWAGRRRRGGPGGPLPRHVKPAVSFVPRVEVLEDRIVPSVAYAPYSFQTLNPPTDAGSSGSKAFGINDQGQIVGTYTDVHGAAHGFLINSDGTYGPRIDVPGSNVVGTEAYGINNSGQIVGDYVDTAGNEHGFVRSNTPSGVQFTPLDVPSAASTQAFGINGAGQIVGDYIDGQGTMHGFEAKPVGSQYQFTPINDPRAGTGASQGTAAHGINNSGQIVGDFVDANGMHGFLLSNHLYSTIDGGNGMATTVSGINDQGEIVGNYHDTNNAQHGFAATPGKPPMPLDHPSAQGGTVASGVNNNGVIAGDYVDSNGVTHSYKATPPPVERLPAHHALNSPSSARAFSRAAQSGAAATTAAPAALSQAYFETLVSASIILANQNALHSHPGATSGL